jgi:hypothetical protein
MTAGVKYENAGKDLAEAKHNFASDVFALCLTNRAPVVATDKFLADITELGSGNGYLPGGKILALTSSSEAAGVYKAIFADPPIWTAAGGTIGPFRYVVLVNQSIGGSPLSAAASRVIGYYDYGASITLQDGETFTPDLDQVNGLVQVQ